MLLKSGWACNAVGSVYSGGLRETWIPSQAGNPDQKSKLDVMLNLNTNDHHPRP